MPNLEKELPGEGNAAIAKAAGTREVKLELDKLLKAGVKNSRFEVVNSVRSQRSKASQLRSSTFDLSLPHLPSSRIDCVPRGVATQALTRRFTARMPTMTRLALASAQRVMRTRWSPSPPTRNCRRSKRNLWCKPRWKPRESTLDTNAPAEAVVVLEKELSNADGAKAYLNLLREAYTAELSQLEKAPGTDLGRESQQHARKLALLGGQAPKPEEAKPQPAPVPAPDLGPSLTGPAPSNNPWGDSPTETGTSQPHLPKSRSPKPKMRSQHSRRATSPKPTNSLRIGLTSLTSEQENRVGVLQNQARGGSRQFAHVRR